MTESAAPRTPAEWFTHCRPELVRFCRRYLGRSDDAEDVVQDVGVSLASQEHIEQPRPWLFRVARNQCINRLRARGAMQDGITLHADSRVASPRTGPRTALDRSERNAALRSAVAGLQGNFAEVLTLRYFEGFGRREIAEVMQCTDREVKALLEQARREIACRLRRQGKAQP